MALSPGPDNIFVLSNSLYNGKKAGIFSVLGLVTGCLFHTTLIAFGVSEFIILDDDIFSIIKLFGSLYMFFLALKVFNSPIYFKVKQIKKTRKSNVNNFLKGVLMNILNPKVYFFFFSFFPAFLFLKPLELNLVYQFYVLGTLFMFTTLTVFLSIVFFSSAISNYLADFNAFHRIMKWIQILIYLSIGFIILFSV
jgi:threonine/homoserine/homoserine lactone efflux protein